MKTNPFRIFIVAKDSHTSTGLLSELNQNGYACSIIPDGERVIEQIAEQAPHLVLLEMNGHKSQELLQTIRQEQSLPIMALVHRETLDKVDSHLDVDDFAIKPYDAEEIKLRVKRLLNKAPASDSSELIKCDALVIDMARCEVTVEGKVVELTFKEYDLLKFLASNQGRVYTREALLNKVWGYDYYGGDRTVDVHIRRLRSKIENPPHIFIETVRNIGYRFRKGT